MGNLSKCVLKWAVQVTTEGIVGYCLPRIGAVAHIGLPDADANHCEPDSAETVNCASTIPPLLAATAATCPVCSRLRSMPFCVRY